MLERIFRIDFRTWFIAMASVAMVLAPMAADAGHVEEQSQSHCEFCVDHDAHEHEDENHHKDHHAHGCGSCHVHNLAAKVAQAFSVHEQNANTYGRITAALSSADLSGPFKPPRL